MSHEWKNVGSREETISILRILFLPSVIGSTWCTTENWITRKYFNHGTNDKSLLTLLLLHRVVDNLQRWYGVYARKIIITLLTQHIKWQIQSMGNDNKAKKCNGEEKESRHHSSRIPELPPQKTSCQNLGRVQSARHADLLGMYDNDY